MTMARAAALLTQAGVPDGVFQTIHGGVDAVNALCDHKSIAALTFVGSSKVRRPICSHGVHVASGMSARLGDAYDSA